MSTNVDIEGFLIKLNNPFNKVVLSQYQKVAELHKLKDNIPHTIEAIHTIIEQ